MVAFSPCQTRRRLRQHSAIASPVTVLIAAAAWLTPPACLGQRSDLAEKLKELNVRLETDHYVLAGTVTDSRLELYGQALEYIHREYRKGFSEVLKNQEKEDRAAGKSKSRDRSRQSGRRSSRRAERAADEEPRTMDQEDEQGRFPVIVFNNRQEYDAFGREFLGGAEHSIGLYVPACKLLLIQDQGNFEDTTEVLFHEAFHQFMHRYVKNPPVWLDEGLAVHYGCARATSGGLTFRQPPAIRWQLTRKLIQKGQALPLWDVVSADRRQFYSGLPVNVSRFENVTVSSLYYAQAYTLVHTLLSDQSGRERLRNYLRDLAADDGTQTDRITREYFGPDVCEHMTSFWMEHVNSRPETH
jgi:hypothetical protein